MGSCLKCLPARSYCGRIQLILSSRLELGEQRCGQGYWGGRNRRLEGGRAGGIQLRLKVFCLIVGVFFDLNHHDLLNRFANGNTPIHTSELGALRLDRLHLILSAASNISLVCQDRYRHKLLRCPCSNCSTIHFPKKQIRKMTSQTIKTPPKCTADFCLIPIGTPTASVSVQIADVQRLMKTSGLSYSMHSAGTTVVSHLLSPISL